MVYRSHQRRTVGVPLCKSDEGYFEFVEVFPYKGSRVDVRPGRFLATG